jgi:hypothetical protein
MLHGGFQHADGLIIDLDRHRVGVPVLAAMGQREPRRIGEAIRRAMHHLGHHRQRLYGAGADAGRQQQLRKIYRTAFGRRRQRAVQAAGEDVAGAHIMVRRHDEMRQLRLQDRLRVRLGRQRGEFRDDAVGAERRQEIKLGVA